MPVSGQPTSAPEVSLRLSMHPSLPGQWLCLCVAHARTAPQEALCCQCLAGQALDAHKSVSWVLGSRMAEGCLLSRAVFPEPRLLRFPVLMQIQFWLWTWL